MNAIENLWHELYSVRQEVQLRSKEQLLCGIEQFCDVHKYWQFQLSGLITFIENPDQPTTTPTPTSPPTFDSEPLDSDEEEE